MSKKIISLLTVLMLCFALAACGSKEASQSANTSGAENATEQTTPDSDSVKIPAGLGSEMGSGRIVVATTGGTSENGAVPVLFVSPGELVQIGFEAWEFDGSKLSYIFVDGALNSKEQLGDTQTSINLKNDELKPGIHKVEVVQFENDEITGNPITYKAASYEVKAK